MLYLKIAIFRCYKEWLLDRETYQCVVSILGWRTWPCLHLHSHEEVKCIGLKGIIDFLGLIFNMNTFVTRA